MVAEEAGRRGDRGDGARRRALPPTARRARPHGLRLVLQRDREPDAVVHPALSLGPRERAGRRPRPPPRVERGLRRRQPGLRRRGRRGAGARSRTRRCSFTTTTSTSRRASCGERAPTALLSHFIHVPWPMPDYWRVLPETIRRAIHEGLLANDVVSFHTPPLAPELPALLRRHPRTSSPTRPPRRSASAGTSPASVRGRSRSTRTSSTSWPRARPSSQQEAAIEAEPARVPHPPRRPDRPVEERRARVPRLRALPRRPSGDARARPDARAPRPVAAGHPRVRGVPRRHPARRARGQRPLPAGGLGAARPPDPGQLPAGGRRLQAVRRPARERDLRRHEPRRQGGAARQRRATGCSSSRRTPAPTTSWASGR